MEEVAGHVVETVVAKEVIDRSIFILVKNCQYVIYSSLKIELVSYK